MQDNKKINIFLIPLEGKISVESLGLNSLVNIRNLSSQLELHVSQFGLECQFDLEFFY